jgi:hypothetical protein
MSIITNVILYSVIIYSHGVIHVIMKPYYTGNYFWVLYYCNPWKVDDI